MQVVLISVASVPRGRDTRRRKARVSFRRAERPRGSTPGCLVLVLLLLGGGSACGDGYMGGGRRLESEGASTSVSGSTRSPDAPPPSSAGDAAAPVPCTGYDILPQQGDPCIAALGVFPVGGETCFFPDGVVCECDGFVWQCTL